MAILLTASFAFGGPVILGGDDLTSHGQAVGGVNQEGWLYIEKAIRGILAGSTRPGATANLIAALGSAGGVGDAGMAIASAAAALTPPATVAYHDGPAAITTFFASLSSGAINPAMIWIAGEGASGDIEADEGAVLTANATAIAAYVGSGGGLMSHGSGPTVYGWLAVVIPGLIEIDGLCESTGATLTAAGMAAFPGLANSDIDDNAGPCHSSFSGNLGSLQVLALDGSSPRVPYIIGGGSGTVIGGGADVPTLSGWMLILLGILLSGTAVFVLNRRA